MIILHEELSLPTSTHIAGGNRSRETLLASTSLLLNSAREIKFKFRKRVARVAGFRRFHCCRCNLILEFRNKKTATELRHRRDFDLALIRSAAGVFASIVERACAGGHRACRRHVLLGEETHRQLAAIGSAMSTIRSGTPPTTRLSRQSRRSLQQLDSPCNRNVVSNVC
jgi:hypothetical protein